jgi:hypothetical protein
MHGRHKDYKLFMYGRERCVMFQKFNLWLPFITGISFELCEVQHQISSRTKSWTGREIMNIPAVALASLTLASAGAAYAAPISDVDYLKASRCRGIAVGLGADTTAIDSYLKRASAGRGPSIVNRADEEFAKAKRQGRGADGKARLQAELSGPCSVYTAA